MNGKEVLAFLDLAKKLREKKSSDEGGIAVMAATSHAKKEAYEDAAKSIEDLLRELNL